MDTPWLPGVLFPLAGVALAVIGQVAVLGRAPQDGDPPRPPLRVSVLRLIALNAGLAIGGVGLGLAITALARREPFWALFDGPFAFGEAVELPTVLRVVQALTLVVGAATGAVMAFLLVDLVIDVGRGGSFVPEVASSARSLAIVLAVGSWIAQIGVNVASRSVPVPTDGLPVAEWPVEWAIDVATFLPDWRMLGLAVVLGVLASVVRAGERAQKDAEGLV